MFIKNDQSEIFNQILYILWNFVQFQSYIQKINMYLFEFLLNSLKLKFIKIWPLMRALKQKHIYITFWTIFAILSIYNTFKNSIKVQVNIFNEIFDWTSIFNRILVLFHKYITNFIKFQLQIDWLIELIDFSIKFLWKMCFMMNSLTDNVQIFMFYYDSQF